MARSRRTARRLAAARWFVLCAVLLAPSSASAAIRPLDGCHEHLVVSPAFAADGTAFCAASVKGMFVLHVTRDHART